ncbi:M48 family metallopeptidase [Simiduia sp. 21SJ11W-1]|uniref:M48 family metallopeptidase n=1 Tax=Simiduia sp. 21SJ11W-1 TaxID=2909669 RepID=UPI00209D8E51|nr:M48 family metallopeptidase [Simiduia sp. 21SJ11W-1]UTA47479.1 M48 family metallopeptidase [Simiduia sp. 21SJ11W-1]
MSEPLTLEGTWQDGASSASCQAKLFFMGDKVTLQATNGDYFESTLTELKLSPSIGRTPRYISFENHHGQFESLQFDLLTKLDERIGSPAMQLIHRLENHLGLVCLATVAVLFACFSYFYWGVPYASKVIANNLPESTLQQAADETFEILRVRYLEPTALSEETQARLKSKAQAFAPDYSIEKLHFFASDKLGANALALPDGTIIFTDELIALTDGNDDEMLAVFGHELGHYHQRHSLRQLLQNSAIAVTIAMVGGDVSALGDLVLTLPVVFSQLAFSRKFELEADSYAGDMLEKNGLEREAFVSILTKLHNHYKLCKSGDKDCEERASIMKYLSTHPHLELRIKAVSGETQP